MKSFEALIDHLSSLTGREKRIMFAIAGPPGAGKSTTAVRICGALTGLGAKSCVVSMDGFHLDNRILGPRGLLERKGAPETFDAAGFVAQINRLSKGEDDVAIPVFDRDRDMAIAGANMVSQQDEIIIVEGNYLLLNDAPWSQLLGLWTESVLINPGMDVLQTRLVQRWIDHGLSADEARERAMGNDMANARTVLSRSAGPSIQLKPDALG